MSNTTEVIAQLAHMYTSAKDRADELKDKPALAALRLREAATAVTSATAIVLLTGDGDWRGRVRTAEKVQEQALSAAGQAVGIANRLAKAMDEAGVTSLETALTTVRQGIAPPARVADLDSAV